MKTIRQRKDELIANIRSKKIPPSIDNKSNPSFTEAEIEAYQKTFSEYRLILLNNGIKNAELINTQLRRMLLAELSKATIYSNLKFLNLLRSRLTEEGIPLAHAEAIMIYVNFNMAEINEDDDFIGDIALEFAEVCKIHYDILINKYHSNIDEAAKEFDIIPLQLPSA